MKLNSRRNPPVWILFATSCRALLCAILLCGLIALPTGTALGLGVRIPNQDAEGIARGNAFAATADNPSAIYYNPAGITQLPGQNASVGVLNYFGINTSANLNTGQHTDSKFRMIPVPQLYYTFTPEKLPLSFGLGVYAPFGLATKWPENSGFRSLAIDATLTYVTLNPVVAWKVNEALSLAIGPTINYSQLKITRGLFAPTDFYEFYGDGFSYGFNAGLRWQPHPKWSLGATYRSTSTMHYDGHSTYNAPIPSFQAPTTADFEYPEIVSAGVSYRPTTNWNFEADVDWTDWNSVKTVTLKGTSAIFGVNLPLALNWHGSWFYEFGATRQLPNGWFVSAGYFYSTESTSEVNFNPVVPDTDLHIGSLGVGRKGQHWRWAVAGQIIAGPARNITKAVASPSGESPNGSYQLFVPALTVSVGYHF